MLLVINNLYRPEIGQSRVVEQVVQCLDESDAPAFVLRARSASVLAQLALIIRVGCRCLTHDIRGVYYTPSRARLSILRDLGIYLASALRQRTLIVHWHGRDIDIYRNSSCWYVRLSKRILASAIHICIAERQAATVQAIWPDAKTVVIPNVVDSGFLDDVRRVRKCSAGELPDRKQVVMIGNLMMSKGVKTFCDLAEAMAGAPVDFHLFGPFGSDDTADANAVARLVKRCASYLHYHGPIYGKDKAGALLRADVFLFPSNYSSEALPLVVLEALTAGCWVIANDIGYLGELYSPRLVLVGGSGRSVGLADFMDAIHQAPRRDPDGPWSVDSALLEGYKAQILSVLFQYYN